MNFMTLPEAIVEARKSQKPNSHGYNAITDSDAEGVNLIFVHSDDSRLIYWETGSGEKVCLATTKVLKPHDLLHPTFLVVSNGAPEFQKKSK
jgi:hypothetical protein